MTRLGPMFAMLTIAVLAVAGFSACQPVVSAPDITLSPDVVTVARATWSEDLGERSRIDVYSGDEHWLSTDWCVPGQAQIATLIGLTPGGEWTARVVTQSGVESASTGFETTGLPAEMPAWTTTGEPGWEGYFFTSTLVSNVYAYVLDERGQVVWYTPANQKHTVVRARPSRNGRGVVYGQTGVKADAGTALLRWVNWFGESERKLELANFTHDFVELADGTVLYTIEDIRTVEGFDVPVVGNALASWSIDGEQGIVWSTFDDWIPGVDGDVAADGVWTHANALDIDPDETVVTFGFRNVSTIVRIDIASGERIWQLGGEQSDYEFPNSDDRPESQHQFQWVNDQLFIFDNRSAPDNSRVLRLSFDESGGTATKTWEWSRSPGVWSFVLGDIHRREDESSMVVYTSAGIIDDIDAEGNVRWELNGALGTTLSYVTPVDSLPGINRQR